MRDNITPEEKLLRLIRGQKPKGKIPANHQSATGPLMAPVVQTKEPLPLRKFIFLVFCASCVYALFVFISPLIQSKKHMTLPPSVAPEEVRQVKKPSAPEVKPYEFYLDDIRGRQVFQSISGEEKREVPTATNLDFIHDLNLVGIISGANLQAVIEDKKLRKTYYLNQGQFLGEIRVEEIREGKVILNYKGRRFELYL